jgi:hypothetical protein
MQLRTRRRISPVSIKWLTDKNRWELLIVRIIAPLDLVPASASFTYQPPAAALKLSLLQRQVIPVFSLVSSYRVVYTNHSRLLFLPYRENHLKDGPTHQDHATRKGEITAMEEDLACPKGDLEHTIRERCSGRAVSQWSIRRQREGRECHT